MVRRVPVLWGIHNDQPSLDLLEGGFISIGWDELGDLTILPRDRDATVGGDQCLLDRIQHLVAGRALPA